MNQHGYGYGAPYGYPPGITPANDLGAGQLPAYGPAVNNESNTVNYEENTKQTFEFNRNVIPGLGLNFSSNSALNSTIASSSATQPPKPYPSTSHLPPDPKDQDRSDTSNGNHTALLDATFPTNPVLEEGELSDGEMEDFYEPREPDSEGLSPYDPSQPFSSHVQNQYAVERNVSHERGPAGNATGNSGADPSTRERSGSYSPYLSPREMTSAQSAASPSPAQVDASFTAPRQGGSGSITAEKLVPQPTHTGEGLATQMTAQAKRAAQEAISSLWPYNIRFSDYVSEGVDASLLRDLFISLGLATDGSYTEAKGASHDDASREVLAQPEPLTNINADGQPTPELTNTVTADSDDASRKTEERKDRIARLLAAKATKPPAAPTSHTSSNIVKPASSKVKNSKTQSEKSKLLQQKMEALRIAREARAKETAESQNPTDVAKTMTDPKDDVATDGSSLDVSPKDAAEAVSDNLESPDDAEDQAASSIPGLFLSSTPQPGPAAAAQKRPVASDFDHMSSVSFKRPFGQKRDSQPFLIDVSDDEDDAEMEIDSPELHPTTLHLPTTPLRTISSRETQQPPTSSYHVISPAAVATPPQGSSGSIQSRPDLESMNKKIEEMKRKIAEAEARKRAKQSQNGSMTPSQPNSFSDADTPGLTFNASEQALHTTVLVNAPSATTAGRGDKSQGFEGMEALHVAKRSDSTSRRRDDRISRSRVASERISLIEAHRRQQLLKLEALRTQVANIEKEIEESRQEEERLIQDVSTMSEPDLESEPMTDVVATISTPGAASSGQTSAADGAETSGRSSIGIDATDPDQGLSTAASHQADRNAEAATLDTESEQQAVEDLDLREPITDAVSMEAGDQLPEMPKSQDEQHSNITQIDLAKSTIDMDPVQIEGSEDMSDDYEPPEAGSTTSMSHSPQSTAGEIAASSPKGLLLATDENEEPEPSPAPTPALQKISLGEREITPDAATKVPDLAPNTRSNLTSIQMSDTVAVHAQQSSRPHPEPYQTPLRYFRAYRFHPRYKESVRGGIRSLTYSNKVDVQKALCPDQQVGQECPRGNACEFQHFESMQVSGLMIDSQIVTVLTEYGNFEADEKQRYISGLRDLLTDLRNRKVKDLDAISQGIIEFRAQFLGDRSRVLPLGSVSL
ncbi:Protein red1 [Paramyrothecium foliicola]|nr:Protein red1 [Paramyrothecium foliicola]